MKKKTPEEYLVELQETLRSTGDLSNYDLSQVNYVNATTKVLLTCKKHNFTWGISPGHLRNGRRCPKCKSAELSYKFSSTTKDFIEKSKEIYGENKYLYDKVNYKKSDIKITIGCKKHGYFETLPGHWLNRKSGCPYCSRENQVMPNKKMLDRIILEGKLIHSDRGYDYSSLVSNKSVKDKQIVHCKVHGPWEVSMDNHIRAKSGCPACSGKVSLAELELRRFIESLGFKTLNNQSLLDKYHIDIYLPEKNIGIEYCGLYYHGELRKEERDYHLKKFQLSKEKGILLLQIFEDEWLNNQDIVKEVLRNKLGKSTSKLYARKLEVVSVSSKLANDFFKKYHLQGETGSITHSYALTVSDGEIVSVMAFTTATVKSGEIELCRFASKGNIVGGFSRLQSRFIKDHGEEYHRIISFSDNRWGIGNVYSTNGYSEESKSAPRYWWCKYQFRYHRRGFQRKYLRKLLKDFKEKLSEAQNARAHGYYKIWDAGVTKWYFEL